VSEKSWLRGTNVALLNLHQDANQAVAVFLYQQLVIKIFIDMRNVEQVFAPGVPHFVGDGFRVHSFIPNGIPNFQKRMDPFILMDYNAKHTFPPSDTLRGVGAHPHAGFETVTIAYKGAVAHHDSGGNSGVIREGGVQWMTAGRGILHKEYHEEQFSKTGGEFQMVQLWVNLPERFKNVAPKYQGLDRSAISEYTLDEGNGVIEVIAGAYNGTPGAAHTFTPIHLMNARLKKGAKVDFSFPNHFNTALLVVEGKISVNGSESVDTDHFVLFKNDGEEFSVEAEENALVLVMSGEPFFEPIVQHGPFVMNSQAEIHAVIRDFNLGKFGYLEN
jgi:redox-sensitive bicupin YhaK (pirin superfamily)